VSSVWISFLPEGYSWWIRDFFFSIRSNDFEQCAIVTIVFDKKWYTVITLSFAFRDFQEIDLTRILNIWIIRKIRNPPRGTHLNFVSNDCPCDYKLAFNFHAFTRCTVSFFSRLLGDKTANNLVAAVSNTWNKINERFWRSDILNYNEISPNLVGTRSKTYEYDYGRLLIRNSNLYRVYSIKKKKTVRLFIKSVSCGQWPKFSVSVIYTDD